MNLSAGTTSGTGVLVAYIAIDSTVEWFERFGSVAAAQSQILSIMAQVSTLYEDQVQIQLQLPYVRVFESEPDPYDGASMDAVQLLSEMFHEWNDHQVDVTRTAAHLLSWRSAGRGQAFINVLCENMLFPGASQDYAASLIPGFGSVADRDLVAHELGHTFSSLHTHCYEPDHYSDDVGDSFYLVVPQTSLFEGSYGQDSLGVERPQADQPCRPQLLGTCPE